MAPRPLYKCTKGEDHFIGWCRAWRVRIGGTHRGHRPLFDCLLRVGQLRRRPGLVVQELKAARILRKQQAVHPNVQEQAAHEHEARVVQKQALPVIRARAVQPHQRQDHQPSPKTHLRSRKIRMSRGSLRSPGVSVNSKRVTVGCLPKQSRRSMWGVCQQRPDPSIRKSAWPLPLACTRRRKCQSC